MATFTNRLRLTLQETGTNENTWGEVVNTQLSLIEDAIAGKTTVDVTTGVDVTLTSSSGSTDESRRAILELSGTPTADINVVIPEVEKLYVVDNKVLGSNSVTLKTVSGTGIVFAGGDSRLSVVYCDGTNIKLITEETKNTDDLTRDNITATTDLTVGGDTSVTGGFTLTGNFTGKGVNVSSNDTDSGYLEDKLLVDSSMSKTTNNDGANETITLGVSNLTRTVVDLGTAGFGDTKTLNAGNGGHFLLDVAGDCTINFSGLSSGLTDRLLLDLKSGGDFNLEFTNVDFDYGNDRPIVSSDVFGALNNTEISSFSVSSEETDSNGVYVTNDGTKMYIVGPVSDEVHEYALGTAYDITSATLTRSASVGSNPMDIHLSLDGTKLYVITSTGSVREYSLSTPFNVSTLTLISEESIPEVASASSTTSRGLHISVDGRYMYIAYSGAVYWYQLATPFSLSTFRLLNSYAESGIGRNVWINGDGAKMYVGAVFAANQYSIKEYDLVDPFDVSSTKEVAEVTYVGAVARLNGITFTPNGELYITGSNDTVKRYTLGIDSTKSSLLEFIADDNGTKPVKGRVIWRE